MRQSWQMWESQIKRQDCNGLIYTLRELPPIQAQTFNQAGELEENKHRSSIVRWVEDPQIRDMLWWYAQEANRLAFGLDVQSVGSVQFTEYSASQEAHYSWHHDVDWTGNAAYDRKISVVLQLSDPSSYEGGDFEFNEVESPNPDSLKAKGTILCFPSVLQHRVSPVTKGTRYSLVSWFEGPRWR
jgi:PKHD-type hydroxylase